MRAVDLFAGAGGWSTGARAAGVKVLAAVNHWPRAVETHRANHPETQHLCQDVGLMDPRELPRHEMLLASPACQGHSRARGTDKPHHDALRSTAWCVVNVAEVTRPRLLAVENVPEFLEWKLYGAWRFALECLGYRLAENILCASAFGVPQERVRLVVTGVLHGKRAPLIQVPRAAKVSARTVLEMDAGSWSPVERPGRSLATLSRIANGRRAHGDDFLLPYYGSARGGRSLDRPLGTLTTVDRYALVRGNRMRMLSVDECRRGMSFPDGYRLLGTRREQMKQLGNAVPPLMAAEVVRQLGEAA